MENFMSLLASLATAQNTLEDPTLAELRRLVEAEEVELGKTPRPYMGASMIGKKCDRAVWMQFRWALPRVINWKGHCAINDGHVGEERAIEYIRKVPGVMLWTLDPNGTDGKQIGFKDRHFAGNLDGVIKGLLQAPKTPHVWENKNCNEKKFKKLQDLIASLGEKSALIAWDGVYYAQSQMYMHYLGLTRHYMTVWTPGNRDVVSVRTEYDGEFALKLIARGERIIDADMPPAKISKDPSWFECKFCDFHKLCHEVNLPSINCRTCASSKAMPDGTWKCELKGVTIDEDLQRKGCNDHRYIPMMLNGRRPTSFDNGEIVYDDGFVDGAKQVD